METIFFFLYHMNLNTFKNSSLGTCENVRHTQRMGTGMLAEKLSYMKRYIEILPYCSLNVKISAPQKRF